MRSLTCAAVVSAALLSACSQNENPQTASAQTPRTAPKTYSRDPFPSTYKRYPGAVTAIT